jgi:DNA-binding transcriptional regulator YdaS (Cro superfamily)
MSSAGFVYAIESGDAVEIGFAKDPVRRSHNIGIGSSAPYCLVGFVAAAPEQEKELHGLLARWRIRGEWFRKEGAVLHFIDMLPNKDVDRDRVQATPREAVDRAIKGASSSAALAAKLGVTRQALSQWRRVPSMRARAVSEITGVPLHELRPDLWPSPMPSDAEAVR